MILKLNLIKATTTNNILQPMSLFENLYNIAYLANLQLNGDPNLSKTDNVKLILSKYP